MLRLSIDVTPEEHRKFQAIGALSGGSSKGYMLKRAWAQIPNVDAMSEAGAIAALFEFLKSGSEQARRSDLSIKSIADIRREACDEARR